MAKRFSKKMKVGLVVLVLIAVGMLLVGGQQFAIYTGDVKPNPVYVAKYDVAECNPTSEKPINPEYPYDMSKAQVKNGILHIEEFQCSVNAPDCKISYSNPRVIGYLALCRVPVSTDKMSVASFSTFGGTKLAVPNCKVFGGEMSEGGWVSPLIPPTNTNLFNVNPDGWVNNEKIVVVAYDKGASLGGTLESGDLFINVVATPYNLRSRDGATNYVTTTSGVNACNLQYLGQQYAYTADEQQKALAEKRIVGDNVLFDQAFPIVVGFSPIDNSLNVIRYNGEWVYVRNIGEVLPITRTKDGRFVTITIAKLAPDIICKPSTPGCSANGKSFTQSEGGQCVSGISATGGTIEYQGKLCQLVCVNNNWQKQNCKTLERCEAGEQFSYERGECIAVGGVPGQGGKVCSQDEIQISSTTCLPKLWIFATIIAIILIMVVATVIVLVSGNTGGRR